MIITGHVTNQVCAAALSFAPLFGMWVVNLVACELEMPFGRDANDLPLNHFQNEMNRALLLLTHEMADHLPHTTFLAKRDFVHLNTSLPLYESQGSSSRGSISQVATISPQARQWSGKQWSRKSRRRVLVGNTYRCRTGSHSTSYMEATFFKDEDHPDEPPIPHKDATTPMSMYSLSNCYS